MDSACLSCMDCKVSAGLSNKDRELGKYSLPPLNTGAVPFLQLLPIKKSPGRGLRSDIKIHVLRLIPGISPRKGKGQLVQLEVARQLTAIKMMTRALALSCLPHEFDLKDTRLAVKAAEGGTWRGCAEQRGTGTLQWPWQQG